MSDDEIIGILMSRPKMHSDTAIRGNSRLAYRLVLVVFKGLPKTQAERL